MNLWIRSQDKEELLIVKEMYIVEECIATSPRGSILPNIKSTGKYKIGDGRHTLGKYNSKKRALEVLDEIQSLIQGHIGEEHINKFDIYNGENTKVYQMPLQ